MKAYVTQENPRLNYVPLMEHVDDVVFVTANDYYPMTQSEGNINLTASIRKKLVGFNPEVDYIVPSGSPLVTAVVFAVIHESSNRFNVLRWSNAENNYRKFTIEV